MDSNLQMNLDTLTKHEAAMKPWPWVVKDSYGYWRVKSDKGTCFDDGSVGGEYWARCSPEDRDGLVALRNAAPALIECARLLREARDNGLFRRCHPSCSSGAFHGECDCGFPERKKQIDAALARLEGTVNDG